MNKRICSVSKQEFKTDTHADKCLYHRKIHRKTTRYDRLENNIRKGYYCKLAISQAHAIMIYLNES